MSINQTFETAVREMEAENAQKQTQVRMAAMLLIIKWSAEVALDFALLEMQLKNMQEQTQAKPPQARRPIFASGQVIGWTNGEPTGETKPLRDVMARRYSHGTTHSVVSP